MTRPKTVVITEIHTPTDEPPCPRRNDKNHYNCQWDGETCRVYEADEGYEAD